MKSIKKIILATLIVFVSTACTGTSKEDPINLYNQIDRSSTPNTLSSSERKSGWEILFDGKSTNGWRSYNSNIFPNCWMIEDNSLTMTSTSGHEDLDIITEKEYDNNFALSVDFKLTIGANSGIIYQALESSRYKYPYETGPEFQIIDQDNWPDPLEDWQICGANYAMYPPKSLPSKPVGEWNSLMLVVDGNHVTQIINGEVVVEYVKNSDDWTKRRNSGKWEDYPDWGKFDKGHIVLQNHGTKVWFRNIKIKEL